jgi:hypothetical protein
MSQKTFSPYDADERKRWCDAFGRWCDEYFRRVPRRPGRQVRHPSDVEREQLVAAMDLVAKIDQLRATGCSLEKAAWEWHRTMRPRAKRSANPDCKGSPVRQYRRAQAIIRRHTEAQEWLKWALRNPRDPEFIGPHIEPASIGLSARQRAKIEKRLSQMEAMARRRAA